MFQYYVLCNKHDCDRMATHFLHFHISFGGKGIISTSGGTGTAASDGLRTVRVCPVVFDEEVI